MNELHGLLTPFRRDRKRDFASGSGAELLRSKVLQALMAEGATPRSSGELPWRTSFGAGLHLLRHQRNDEVLAELARVYVRDALTRWVPSARLVALQVNAEVRLGGQRLLGVVFDVHNVWFRGTVETPPPHEALRPAKPSR